VVLSVPNRNEAAAAKRAVSMARMAWIGASALGMIIAAVMLALAGWDAAQIIGLLAAVAAVVTPLFVLMTKTEEVHSMVNSQRSADLTYRQELSSTLREAGIKVPPDATGHTD
jgi:MFS family permease